MQLLKTKVARKNVTFDSYYMLILVWVRNACDGTLEKAPYTKVLTLGEEVRLVVCEAKPIKMM